MPACDDGHEGSVQDIRRLPCANVADKANAAGGSESHCDFAITGRAEERSAFPKWLSAYMMRRPFQGPLICTQSRRRQNAIALTKS